MAETTETRDEREARWWREWFEADYSWEGLARKEILGGGQFGEKTLQDYWRRDPETGRARSDTALKKTGELVQFDGRWWHLVYLPPSNGEGASSWKADRNAPEWEWVNALVAARLKLAIETPGWFDLRVDGWGWAPKGLEGRALLDGAVLGIVRCLARLEDGVAPLALSCRRSAFLGDLHFGSAPVASGAEFSNAAFFGDASFDGTAFPGGARFYGAIFSAGAYFYGAKFSGEATFDVATFSGDSSFTGATFLGDASFEGAAFLGEASFECENFSGGANFYSALFSDYVVFDAVTISKYASFSGVIFSGVSRFEGANFLSEISFEDVTFASGVSFEGSSFGGVSLFSGLFEGLGRFHSTNFVGAFRFAATVVAPEYNFSRAFYGARFAGIADFTGAVEEGQGGRMAAAFAEAHFEKALILSDGLDGKKEHMFHKVLLASTRAVSEDARVRDAAFATLESGCRVVKIAMGKARDEVREQAYYRLQLRARHQRGDIDDWEKAIGLVYGVASDFGSSLWRPLAWLAVLVVVFAAAIYWPWMGWLNIKDADGPGGVFVALNHSLRTLSPFNLLAGTGVPHPGAQPTSLFEVNPAVTFGARLVSGLQSILSGVLIFLFGLAVKRRFQIS